MAIKEKKSSSIVVITLLYIIAGLLTFAVFSYFKDYSVYVRILLADTAGTIFIYLIGVLLNNSSLYDPYWSVAPLIILPAMSIHYNNFNLGAILLFLVVFYWGVRLTCNWAYTFTNLNHQDWRYDYLKEKSGKLFQIVNFFGIHYIPTLVVYFAIIPGVKYIEVGSPVNFITILGVLLCVGATTLQMISDFQMHEFRKNAPKGALIRQGLWKYSRHPNYLGEILMWWGVFVICISASTSLYKFGFGALINTCLFLFISIPLADGRYSRIKPGFEEYKKETRMLLPIRKKSS